jgi:hypothetical protein
VTPAVHKLIQWDQQRGKSPGPPTSAMRSPGFARHDARFTMGFEKNDKICNIDIEKLIAVSRSTAI